MTRRDTARTRTPGDAELGDAIAHQARWLADYAAAATTPPKHRAAALRRLRAAWEALRPRQWSTSTTRRAVVQALEFPARALREGKITEAVALTRAIENLRGVIRDPWAPADLAGRDVRAETVLAYLRAPLHGRPRRGQPSRYTALRELSAQLGLPVLGIRATQKFMHRTRRRAT